jgi:hypothetical protein
LPGNLQPASDRTITGLLWLVLALCITRFWLMPLTSSFWVDEMVTAFVVQHPDHWSFAIAPQVPASIYYWLPAVAQRLVGASEFVYRIPSVIAMAVGLYLIGRIVARLLGPGAAWFAVFACLGLRRFNYQADDARPYALGICVSAAGLFFLIRWLDKRRWTDAGLFIVFGALLWRVHLIYWPFYLVFVVYAVVRIGMKETDVGWGQAIGVFVLVGLSLIPVAMKAFSLLHEAGAHVIMKVPGYRALLHQIRWNLVAICGAASWIIARSAGQGKTASSVPRTSLALVLAWWLMQPVCLYLFSRATGNSVFLERYMSIAVPGIAFAATAATAFWIPPRHWRAASLTLGVGVLLVTGNWSVASPRHDNSDWRGAALTENALALNADTPVICPSPFIEARFPVWRPDYPLPAFLYSHLPWYPLKGKPYLFPFEPLDGRDYAEQITGILAKSDRFMIYGGDKTVVMWMRWFSDRPDLVDWHSRLELFGDIGLAVFDRSPITP